MLFVELRFLIFLYLVFAVYWFVLRRNRSRKVFLLVSSYFFYSAWDYRFLAIIVFITAVNYVVGLKIAENRARGSILLATSVFCSLAVLAVFKYFNFFEQSLQDLLSHVGIQLSRTTLKIVLPVGISFFTFQAMSYTIDIYRGKVSPTKNYWDFSLYIAFFAQLVAGPIVRSREFLSQLAERRELYMVPIRVALLLFLVGFFKKAVVSDNISPIVDALFKNPQDHSALGSVFGAFLFSLQIYCDFSGYSDMAIATAWLLGYRLTDNFNLPYFSQNVQEFWRRWHISLSTWLKDYLYISLGGNRKGRPRQFFNLMTTMLLGGLWHGPTWTMVAWGGLHGLGLTVHRIFQARRPAQPFSLFGRVFGTILTFLFVTVCWVFFRADTFGLAWEVLTQATFFLSPGFKACSPLWLAFYLVLPLEWYFVRRWIRGIGAGAERLPGWAFASLTGVAMALIVTLVQRSATPFIYFQF